MSKYNIREKFSYSIASSSIEYIKNYNFNSTTVTDIPLVMENTDSEIPITINITTTEPWIRVVDPLTGADLKYPVGNVVLQPTSSTIVFLKIDLPPEIENTANNFIPSRINLDIKSGSFLIIPPTSLENTQNKNVITVETGTYYLRVGDVVPVTITVYDINGNQDLTAEVTWTSNDINIVQIENPNIVDEGYNPYTPRNLRAIAQGTTTVTISTTEQRTTTITVIITPQNDIDTINTVTTTTRRNETDTTNTDTTTQQTTNTSATNTPRNTSSTTIE